MGPLTVGRGRIKTKTIHHIREISIPTQAESEERAVIQMKNASNQLYKEARTWFF